MGILQWMGLEKRAKAPSDDFWYSWPGQQTTSGVTVSERESLKYLTVYSCVSLIAGDVARLPLNLYRKRTDGGKDLVLDHPLYDILHNTPNPDTTSFNWREASQGHLLLWGNHYSYIERSKTGQVVGLWMLPDPGAVSMRRRAGRIVYEYKVDGTDVVRTRDEIFHVPGYGWDGLRGMSMIDLSREAIGMGLATEEFGSRFFGQGTHPAGVLELDGYLGDGQEAYAKGLKQSYAGLGKSHGIMLMQGGAKYKPLTMPLDNAQFLESRNFQKSEIAGMYHVPLHKIGVHGSNSNYNNLEQENAGYVDSCLMGWLVRWESAISLQLLTPAERKSGLFVEFLVQGLLRGDSQARSEYYNKLFQVGAITPNEIRAKENANPIDGGDQSFVQLNLIPLDQAGEIDMTLPGDEPEKPEDIDIKEQKSIAVDFFGEPRARELAEQRSILARDRISRRYMPLILDAAEAVVKREATSIKRKIPEGRAVGDATFEKFLIEFYNSFPAYIVKKMGPVLRAYLNAIIDQAKREIKIKDVDLDLEVKQFIERYAERHIETSRGQIIALIDDPDEDVITERIDAWIENRPGQIAINEVVRAGGAAFSWVVFGAGLSLVWRIRGAKTCPYCKSLDGKKIKKDEHFVKSGDVIDPKDGTGPMKIWGLKKHPPIHRACDCYTVAGT